MIKVFTKKRHVNKIKKFLSEKKVNYEIYTDESCSLKPFELGVSYCYPKKIKKPLLFLPKKGFVNYHPGPLPKYKGPNQYQDAIDHKETNWGVTCHFMDEKFDTGPIIKVQEIKLEKPSISIEELGALSHHILFQLFKYS